MFRIGEFSKLVRVSPRMLRYYDKCGLLCPAQTDRFTGYRLYGAGQIPLLLYIVALRDMGFGVEEIRGILSRDGDENYLRRALERKRGEILAEIAAGQDRLERIAAVSGQLQKENAAVIFDVELKSLPRVKVLSLRETIPAYDEESRLWHKLGRFLAHNSIPCGEGGYSIYHDEEHKESEVDVEVAVPVPELLEDRDGLRYRELEAIPRAATIRFAGPYENYNPAMEKLAAWLEGNGYVMDGLIRGLAIRTPQNQSDPRDYLTELQVPVKEAAGAGKDEIGEHGGTGRGAAHSERRRGSGKK